MKRLILILAMLAVPTVCQAQYNFPYNLSVSTPPSGTCSLTSPQTQILQSNGAIYTCDNGTWTAQTGSGGGAAPGSNTDVPYNCSGLLCANNNFTDDGSGNIYAAASLQVGAPGTMLLEQDTGILIANLPAATLPAYAPATTGSAVAYWYTQVLDGISVSDCTVGGGTVIHRCYSTGTIWTNPVPSGSSVTIPPWLTEVGTGIDGALTCAGSISGVRYVTTFTIASATTCTCNSAAGCIIHATGTATINGTFNARGFDVSSTSACGGGSGGGSGGGTAAGTAGISTSLLTGGVGTVSAAGGAAGAITGGAGTSGNASASLNNRFVTEGGCGDGGAYLGGGNGQAGGTAGGARGFAGNGIVIIAGSITGTGVIDVSGEYGTPSAANLSGSGSGGGGGVAILSSIASVSTWPTIYAAPGSGAGGGTTTSVVPEAIGFGGSCTTEPVIQLAVSTGALTNTGNTILQAGVGCGTGAGVAFAVLGGGGTLGTGTIAATWSGGAVSTITVTPGTSSGYTAATFTTAGTGGNGGSGWCVEFANGLSVACTL